MSQSRRSEAPTERRRARSVAGILGTRRPRTGSLVPRRRLARGQPDVATELVRIGRQERRIRTFLAPAPGVADVPFCDTGANGINCRIDSVAQPAARRVRSGDAVVIRDAHPGAPHDHAIRYWPSQGLRMPAARNASTRSSCRRRVTKKDALTGTPP